jgi:ABC-type siderophore export system fused ATPase/permease subunit
MYVDVTAHKLDEYRDVFCDVFILAHLFTLMQIQNGGSTR